MYSLPTSAEKSKWTKFVHGLDQLNRQQRVTSMRFALLKNHIKFCAQQSTEKVCGHRFGSTQYISSLESYGKSLDQQIAALNRAYELSQRGLAFMRSGNSDFSIVVPEGLLSEDQLRRATFVSEDLPSEMEELGFLAPIIIAGVGAVIIVVSAAWTAIEESRTKQKRLDTEIQKATVLAETTLAKDPDAFGRYKKYRAEVIKPAVGMIDKLLGGGTSKNLLGIGALIVVGLILFKTVQLRPS